MYALLDSPSILENNNIVCLLDRGQAMSNGDGCATLGYSVESRLDNLLTLSIDGARGFVKNDNARLLDDTPSDG